MKTQRDFEDIPPLEPIRERKPLRKKVLAVLGVIIGGVYIMNPGMGIFEILPDNLPFVGNLDEVFFGGVLVYSLSYLGVRIPWLTRRFVRDADARREKGQQKHPS